jgi:hypothetical protein
MRKELSGRGSSAAREYSMFDIRRYERGGTA